MEKIKNDTTIISEKSYGISPPGIQAESFEMTDPSHPPTSPRPATLHTPRSTSFISFPTQPPPPTDELDVDPTGRGKSCRPPAPTGKSRSARPSSRSRAREALAEGLGTLWNMIKPPEMPEDTMEMIDVEEDEGGRTGMASRPNDGDELGRARADHPAARGKDSKLLLERTRSRTASAIGNGFHRIRTRTKSGRDSVRAGYMRRAESERDLTSGSIGEKSAGREVRCVVVDNDVWKEDEMDADEGNVEDGMIEGRTSLQSDRHHQHQHGHSHHHHHHHHHHSHPTHGESGEHAWATGSYTECGRRPSVSSSTGTLRRWLMCVTHSLQDFFATRFEDPERETHYLQEAWVSLRQSAMPTSLLYILAWGLTWGLSGRPLPVYNRWAFIFANGFLSVPLPFFVMMDLMRRIPWLYQCWVLLASWAFAYAVLVDMHVCGYYTGYADQCVNSPNFIALFFWSIALPVFGLLGLGQKRLFHLIGLVIWCALTISLIIVPGAPNLMIRNLILLISLHVFLVVMSYFWEKSSRRMFTLRAQIKDQYMKTEMARRAEALANQSSRKFIAYVFHEIRGPLNRCTLNFGLFVDEHVREVDPEKQEMVTSVNNDFQLMSRVLNDVLSLDRIRLGFLEPSVEPFRLDRTVSLAVSGFRSQADALGLHLELESDPKISDLVLMGDAGRIQQLVGNLIGNSLKFTKQGGVTIVTRLLGIVGHNPPAATDTTTPTEPDIIAPILLPTEVSDGPDSIPEISSKRPSYSPTASSASSCRSRSRPTSVRPARNRAVVRIEVRDTGVGFSAQDVDENRLFSEYRQTKIGMKQGASGSGLGLALCRKFVEVFQGRLGVYSEPGKGSTFWFEIPFPIHSVVVKEEAPVMEAEEEILPLKSESREISAASSVDPIAPIAASAPSVESPTLPLTRPALISTAVKPQDVSSIPTTSGTSKPVIAPEDDPLSLDCLVVDDCPMTRTLMTKILRRMGHRVNQAEDGVPALQMIRERETGTPGEGYGYDVVFLDNMMPVMTGEEAVRELRRRGCKVFVVGATGNALKEDQDAYVAAGVDEILTKPVFADKIRRVVGIALERKKTRMSGKVKQGAAEDNVGGGEGGGGGDGGTAGIPGGR